MNQKIKNYLYYKNLNPQKALNTHDLETAESPSSSLEGNSADFLRSGLRRKIRYPSTIKKRAGKLEYSDIGSICYTCCSELLEEENMNNIHPINIYSELEDFVICVTYNVREYCRDKLDIDKLNSIEKSFANKKVLNNVFSRAGREKWAYFWSTIHSTRELKENVDPLYIKIQDGINSQAALLIWEEANEFYKFVKREKRKLALLDKKYTKFFKGSREYGRIRAKYGRWDKVAEFAHKIRAINFLETNTKQTREGLNKKLKSLARSERSKKAFENRK